MWELLGKVIKNDFIPAFAFSVIMLLVFEPIMPPIVSQRLFGDFTLAGQFGLVVLVLTIVLGSILSNLNTFIFNLFSGSVLLWRIPLLKKIKQKQFQEWQTALRKNERIRQKLWDHLDQLHESEYYDGWYRKLVRKDSLLDLQKFVTVSNIQTSFPLSPELVMPTRFGNILRIAEQYPMDRYEMNAAIFWPRLESLLPDELTQKIVQNLNACSFSLNCSLLSIILAFFSLCAVVYQMFHLYFFHLGHQFILYFVPILSDPIIYYQRMGLYLLGIFLALLVAYFFYSVSLLSVSQYVNVVMSAYDLHRFKILMKLNFQLPSDSIEERNLWRKVNRFLATGPRDSILAKGKPFEYYFQTNESEKMD